MSQAMTVEKLVELCKRKKQITVNPLSERDRTFSRLCFRAAKLGLIKKERVSCGSYIFTPIESSEKS